MKHRLQEQDRQYAKKYLKTSLAKKHKMPRFKGKGYFHLNNSVISSIFNKPILKVPKIFDIIQTHFDDKLTNFLSDLEEVLKECKHVYLSFKETEAINLPMLLLIYALQDKYYTKISVIWSDSPFVNRMIMDSGSFASIEKRAESLINKKTQRIHVISGSNAEYNDLSEALIDGIIEKYYGGHIPPTIEGKISQAIIETLENVGRHAYPNEPTDSEKKWWLVCSIGTVANEANKYMYLAIYDSGRGIPFSLEDSEVFQHRVKTHYPKEYRNLMFGEPDITERNAINSLIRKMKNLISSFREIIGDAGLIYASMMHDMTRLDDDSHGQGSVSIKELITDDPNSQLFILSNKGCYQFNKGAEPSDKEHVKVDLNNELAGTLLQWSIKLDEL